MGYGERIYICMTTKPVFPASPYLRLMRLHQRAGIWLLWWPCAWSLALHSAGLPPQRLLELLGIFALGAIAMRSAGCIINDIADRTFDAQVERTRLRPLASGELNVAPALALLALLLAVAAGVAYTLGHEVWWWSLAALPLVCAYPLMKRITDFPQLVLGLTFNWGALVGAVAVHGTVTTAALLLYSGCVLWTLGYDTLYAHQDKAGDIRAGVRSSALALGENTQAFVAGCYGVACLLWMGAAYAQSLGWMGFAAAAVTLAALTRQVARVDIHNPASCAQAFRSNVKIGWFLFIGWIIAIYSSN